MSTVNTQVTLEEISLNNNLLIARSPTPNNLNYIILISYAGDNILLL